MKTRQITRCSRLPLLLGICCMTLSASVAAYNPEVEKPSANALLTAGNEGPGIDFSRQLRTANAAYFSGDYPKALRLFRNIAVLGIPEAHFRLGIMYAKGLGIRQSNNQAEYWLKLAAKENYPGAFDALESLKSGQSDG